MHLNMCIPHLFNKHNLALIIYDNTLEETSKHSAVDYKSKEALAAGDYFMVSCLETSAGTGTQTSSSGEITRCNK